MDFVIGFDGYIVYFHKTVTYAVLNFRACDIRQPIHQKLINAKQALAGIGYNAVVLEETVFVIV
jgi:hypothetical protein